MGGKKLLIDATSGRLLSPLDKQTEEAAAARYYHSGDGQISEIELLIDSPSF